MREPTAGMNRFMFTKRILPELASTISFRIVPFPCSAFLQSDPIGFGAGDANLFRYCGGIRSSK